jgi:hypothetical protein
MRCARLKKITALAVLTLGHDCFLSRPGLTSIFLSADGHRGLSAPGLWLPALLPGQD